MVFGVFIFHFIMLLFNCSSKLKQKNAMDATQVLEFEDDVDVTVDEKREVGENFFNPLHLPLIQRQILLPSIPPPHHLNPTAEFFTAKYCNNLQYLCPTIFGLLMLIFEGLRVVYTADSCDVIAVLL